jgi:creatinine amidohydrolase/Fe(II)-dependent formamide hydrolase-like protein
VCAMASSANAQIHRLEELSTDRIAALDRSHTVVLMPGGILEEHGPYLPRSVIVVVAIVGDAPTSSEI